MGYKGIKYVLFLLFVVLSTFSGMAQDSIKIHSDFLWRLNTHIDKAYEAHDGKVYYVHVIDIGSSRSILRKMSDLTELDPLAFVIVGEIYAKDNTQVYRMAKKLPDADPISFEVLDSQYSRDSRNVYYNDSIIVGADAKSFQIIDNRDKNNNRWQLQLCLYSKDKNRVYFSGKQIEQSDPASFVQLAYPYSKDKNHVYWHTKIIVDADVKTFTPWGEPYSKDDKHVFFEGVKIDGINAAAFKAITNWYSKDDKHVYYKTKILEKANPHTFRYYPHFYGMDDKHVYYNDKLVEGIDIKNASDPMYNTWINDDKSLFYKWTKVEGVDISAFALDWHEGAAFVYDKEYIYYKGQKEKIDLKSFSTYANVRPPMDKDYIFLIEKIGLKKIENNKQNRKKYNIHDFTGFNKLK